MTDWISDLRRLHELKEEGIITEEEFLVEKTALLPQASEEIFTSEYKTQDLESPHTDQETPKQQSRKSKPPERNVLTPSLYPLKGLGKAISILMIIFAASNIYRLLAFIFRASLLDDLNGSSYFQRRTRLDDIVLADNSVITSSSLVLISNAIVLICMIVWAWRVTSNLDEWGKSHRWGKGWAIGGWFTPIMLLFVPYQVISDSWKSATSESEPNQTDRNTFWLIGYISWWVMIAFNVLARNPKQPRN